MKHTCAHCQQVKECKQANTTVFKGIWLCEVCAKLMAELKLFIWE